MSTERRMYPHEQSIVLMLLSWCLCTGLCEEVSGRNHRLQQLLRTLEDNSTKMIDYKPASKIFTTQIPPSSHSLTGVHPIRTGHHHPPIHNLDSDLSDGPIERGPLPPIPPHNQIDADPPSIKSYQDFYKVFYGTQAGMDHIRKQYGPKGLQEARAKFRAVNRELDDVRQANDHFLRIQTKARCRVPVARVVRVKDYYPDPSMEYLPRCTVLHRCGDGAGCCVNDAFQCVPSAMQEVTLHFYTFTVGRNGLGSHPDRGIEKLLFVNHTACHCQPINDLPRLQQPPLDGRPGCGQQAESKCRDCPVPFSSRTHPDGRCGCDCFDKQKPCLRIKRGREPLHDIERRCVEAKQCHIPDCEFGLYDPSNGYCPKRPDEDKSPPHNSRPNRNQISSSHRWAFIERD